MLKILNIQAHFLHSVFENFSTRLFLLFLRASNPFNSCRYFPNECLNVFLIISRNGFACFMTISRMVPRYWIKMKIMGLSYCFAWRTDPRVDRGNFQSFGCNPLLLIAGFENSPNFIKYLSFRHSIAV